MQAFRQLLAVAGLLYFCIFVHEAGHFVLFKAQNVGVSTFKIGIGPTLLRYEGEETDYELGLIPLGGYNYPASRTGLSLYSEKDLEDLEKTRPAKHAMLTDESRFVENASRIGNIITDIAGVSINFVCAWLGMFLLIVGKSPFNALRYSLPATARQVYVDALNILSAGRSKLGKRTIGDTLDELIPGFRLDTTAYKWTAVFVSLSIALGIFNLLPIPPLDGGKVLLEVIQMFTGELDIVWLAVINLTGFVLLISHIIYYHTAPSSYEDEEKKDGSQGS